MVKVFQLEVELIVRMLDGERGEPRTVTMPQPVGDGVSSPTDQGGTAKATPLIFTAVPIDPDHAGLFMPTVKASLPASTELVGAAGPGAAFTAKILTFRVGFEALIKLDRGGLSAGL